MEKPLYARSLYNRWDTFFYNHIEKVLDRVINEIFPDADIPEIEELTLQLGTIPEDKLDRYYPELLAEKLTLALRDYLPGREPVTNNVRTNESYLLEILCLYLLHGRLPWHIHLAYPTLGRLFLAVLRIAAPELKRFLLGYGHYTGLQQRLVTQVDDPALESGIRLLAPHESSFLCSYIHLLQEKYKVRQLETSQEKYRDITWLLVYKYLLTNQSSYFNKKSFIYTTLSHLAKEYNTSYSHLLMLLTGNPENAVPLSSTPVELFMILNELRQDMETQHRADLLAGKAVWKDKNEIIRLLKERKRVPPSSLRKVLEGGKNASFRQQLCETLSEQEHYFLIRLLEPANSRFIIAYARGLGRQKQTGSLQGKAGSNYQALKWNFIYDILFLSRQQVFNKKQFIRRTLARLAAHYNVPVNLLLIYYHEEIILTDNSLPFDVVQAIRELFTETISKKQENPSGISGKPVPPSVGLQACRRLLKKYIPANAAYNQLLDTLANHYLFICWLEPFLKTVASLSRHLLNKYQVMPQYTVFLQWLIRLAGKQAPSLNTLTRLLIRYLTAPLAEQERFVFLQDIRQFAGTDPLLAEYLANNTDIKKPQPDLLLLPPPLQTYIGNAGMILVSPFFPLLFSRLELTGRQGFKGKDEQLKAIYLLQYLVWGSSSSTEYEMELNRLLTGYPTGYVVGRYPELTPHENNTINSMLQGVLQNWKKLKGTSVAGLREGFLQREGKLEEKDDSYLLQVETRSYDILLDSVPWNFRTVNYSWMEKPLFVNWR